MEKEHAMLGLTKQELLIYETLVRAGSFPASEIASLTNLNRSFVYHCLQALQERGLVTILDTNKKYNYKAVDPSRLLGLFKENEIRLKAYVATLEKQKPAHMPRKPDIQVFFGKEGMKAAIEEELTAKELLVLGSTPEFEKNLPFYRPGFHLRRIEKAILLSVLFYESDRMYGQKVAKMKYAEARFLSDSLKMPATTALFNDIALLAFWNPIPHAIRIRNKETAESFRKYFWTLWKEARK